MKKADIEFAGVELNAAEIETPKSTRNFKKWLIPVGVVAAGLTLFFALENMVGLSEGRNKKTNTEPGDTKRGSRTQIQLPYGSLVRLNSSSKFRPMIKILERI